MGGGNDPGWFVCFQERPGQPRFGADIGNGGPLPNWSALNWGHLTLVAGHVSAATSLNAGSPNVSGQSLAWGATSNSAQIASILYQDPVLVAVHAGEMLEP